MLVDAVDQRAVEIEHECHLPRRHRPALRWSRPGGSTDRRLVTAATDRHSLRNMWRSTNESCARERRPEDIHLLLAPGRRRDRRRDPRAARGRRPVAVAGPGRHGGRPRLVAPDHRGDRQGRVPGPGDDAGGAALRGRPPRVALRPPAGPLRRAGGRPPGRSSSTGSPAGWRARDFYDLDIPERRKRLHPPAREPGARRACR